MQTSPANDRPVPPPLSKRATRRLIQRALVLAGRRREVRQHIRHLQIGTVWSLQDWGLEWTVEIDRGRLHFDRRPVKDPALRLTWTSSSSLFGGAGTTTPSEPLVEGAADLPLRRALDILCRTFRQELEYVIRNPVDERGIPLV
jgi:hypothetical protein